MTGGTPRTEPRTFFWHFPHYSPQRGSPAGAVIEGGDKYIEWYSDVDSTYFFNLNDDPGEAMPQNGNNIDRATELREKLNHWRDTIGARFMTVNPNFSGERCE